MGFKSHAKGCETKDDFLLQNMYSKLISKYEKITVTIGLYPDTSKHLVYINYLLAELYRRTGEFEKAAEKILIRFFCFRGPHSKRSKVITHH